MQPAHFMIGDPVETDIGTKMDDYRGVKLWVAGIRAEFNSGAITYTLSETWPPTDNRDLSDMWEPGDIIPRCGAEGGAA